jgi:orotate phosphoribosyltransferase
MENVAFNVPLDENPHIYLGVIPGHFTTSYAHVNHYLDLNEIKSNMLMAREVAKELTAPYLSKIHVDTIVCMERTEVVGAFLAEELVRGGAPEFTNDGSIHIVQPINSVNGNLIFQGSTAGWITGKNIILLAATISSGRTVRKALECLAFYGGKPIGISTLFLASKERQDEMVHPLFIADDIPDYSIWGPAECELCKCGVKLDAIISSEGYTRI